MTMDGGIDGQLTVEAMVEGVPWRATQERSWSPGRIYSLRGQAVVAMDGASAMAMVMDFDRMKSASNGSGWRGWTAH